MDAAAKALPAGGLVTVRKPDGKGARCRHFQLPSTGQRPAAEPRRDAEDRPDVPRPHAAPCLALRERLFAEPCYRLIHPRPTACPALVVDRFGKALVCQFNTAGMALLEADVLAALDQVVAPRSSSCATTARRASPRA